MLQQRSAARLSVAYGVCARAFAHVGRQGAAGSAGVALAAGALCGRGCVPKGEKSSCSSAPRRGAAPPRARAC